jgi:alkylation response protein AidB-like acyl-CoA dehydrogenase
VNFGLSEEQELLQSTVHRFLEDHWSPQRRRVFFDGSSGKDAELWRGMAELGLVGLLVEEKAGGAGLELLDLALVAEILGRFAAPGPFLGHSLATLALSLGGSEAQKERWLPALASGEAIATLALVEPGGGWDPLEWGASLSPAGAGLRISGEKLHVPDAEIADLFVVGVTGGGLALVERASDGVRVEANEGIDRTRRVGRVGFEGAVANLLPGGNEAAPRVRDAGLVLLAADAFGGASRCVELAVEYAKTRVQFGVTIGHFQAVKHQLANMAVEIEPARSLYWYAAHAYDHLPAEFERHAALAKAHLTDRFMQIARDTVETHGGIGFTWECDVQIWYKRAMFDRAFLGAPAVHRERAARLAGW